MNTSVKSHWIIVGKYEVKAIVYTTVTQSRTWVYHFDIYYKRLYNIETAEVDSEMKRGENYYAILEKSISNDRGKVIIKSI